MRIRTSSGAAGSAVAGFFRVRMAPDSTIGSNNRLRDQLERNVFQAAQPHRPQSGGAIFVSARFVAAPHVDW
jgi:hypothetical protein